MRADFSIDCNSEAHIFMTYYAWVMVLLIPIGIPLLYVWLFHAYRRVLSQIVPPHRHAALRSTHDSVVGVSHT